MSAPRGSRLILLLAVLGLVSLIDGTSARGDDSTVRQVEFFERKIRPVLVTKCYSCHSAEAKKIRGGLRLDTREAIRKGGDSGPAIVPGDAARSLLLKALAYDELKMPPEGKLSPSVLGDFETWVRTGAVDPRDGSASMTSSHPRKGTPTTGQRAWAFQRPAAHPAPPVRETAQVRRKLDAFLLARLEREGRTFSPPADRRTWLRRVTFDLIGLPPTPAETDAYLSDPTPEADTRVVERLLASPHYGARWARVWLDVARYAEDQAHIVGSDASLTYPNAYLYRDWVIHALNNDLPYDRFVKLQLAADLLEPSHTTDLPALGFLGLGPKYYQRNSLAVMADEWEDRVDVVGRGLLGLTVACARCHDHKYDPIATEDYHGLAGVFASTRMFNRPLTDKVAKNGEDAKQPTDALHIVREGTPTDLTVFIRGDVNNKGPVVPRHFLPVLMESASVPLRTGSGRRELADVITSPRNPLLARVLVNRIWATYFGRGIVGTPSNFGALGDPPTHPQLLDDLAVRFMESGWSIKNLHREIALSNAYRQSSVLNETAGDPDNRLLGRMPRRRLGVEAWRDAILSATGQLDPAVGGRSLDPLDPKEKRRTVYSRISRLELNRLLAVFDFPDPNVTADRRVETTTPLQKMLVLNSPFMVAQAEALAHRLQQEISDPTDGANSQRIERAYLLLYGRPPTGIETRLGKEFLAAGRDERGRWATYAHVLLAASEMMYLD